MHLPSPQVPISNNDSESKRSEGSGGLNSCSFRFMRRYVRTLMLAANSVLFSCIYIMDPLRHRSLKTFMSLILYRSRLQIRPVKRYRSRIITPYSIVLQIGRPCSRCPSVPLQQPSIIPPHRLIAAQQDTP
jgi:hypothetical protein